MSSSTPVLFAAATSCHLCAAVGYCSEECCAEAQSRYHWLECGDAQHLLRVRMSGVGCTIQYFLLTVCCLVMWWGCAVMCMCLLCVCYSSWWHVLNVQCVCVLCVCVHVCVCDCACALLLVCGTHLCAYSIHLHLLWLNIAVMLAGQLDGVAWFEDTLSKLSHWATR